MAIDERRFKIIHSAGFPADQKQKCYDLMHSLYSHLWDKGLTTFFDGENFFIVQSRELARQAAEAEAKKS